MNQEQILDGVAEQLKKEAETHTGTLLVCFTDDIKMHRIHIKTEEIGTVLGIYDANKVKAGLPPSAWLELGKKIWTEISKRPGPATNTIKPQFGKKQTAAGNKGPDTPGKVS